MNLSLSRRTAAGLAVLGLALTTAACGGSDSSDAGSSGAGSSGSTTLTVLAASSLTGSFTELGKTFESQHPGVTVKFAFDSSATLAQQATGGAPADVLATADPTTMDSAKSAQAASPQTFATNTEVMVVPADNPGGATGFADLKAGRLTYVACVDTAPCGIVWKAIAADDGVTAKPASYEVDVKSVLAKVTSGEADAGIVYKTDAQAAGSDVKTFQVPGASDHVTSYPIAPLTQSKDPQLAQDFVDLVTSAQGQKVLASAGFGAP